MQNLTPGKVQSKSGYFSLTELILSGFQASSLQETGDTEEERLPLYPPPASFHLSSTRNGRSHCKDLKSTIDFMDSAVLHQIWGKTKNKALKLLELSKIQKLKNQNK